MDESAARSGLFSHPCAGVLLHPTSLPGPQACGSFGDDARRFVDFLGQAGFSVWQTLPLGPVDEYGSPYSLSSAYAGDIRLIDTATLTQLRDIPADLPVELLHQAPRDLYSAFCSLATDEQAAAFSDFMRTERDWLLPFTCFEYFSEKFDDSPWWKWPEDFANCSRTSVFSVLADDEDGFRAIALQQFLFSLQWSALKSYANEKGIRIFGDLPFYMDRNSVDAWWERSYFALDEHGAPLEVAGVPPDYFSAEGQLWGNPLYDWDAMRADSFAWWRRRLEHQLRRFDILRIDHFRALESYWSIPAAAQSAREGNWVPGAGAELLAALSSDGPLPLVAEDLGIITDAVRALRDRFELPGMAVLQFGFDGSPDNPHLPANVAENSVFYTGTHDNDTLIGWYASLTDETKDYVATALGADVAALPDDFVRIALDTRAALVVIPMQDLLELDSSARMNTPGVARGNWSWRFGWLQLDANRRQRIERLLNESHRSLSSAT